jgi:hypothetical protein
MEALDGATIQDAIEREKSTGRFRSSPGSSGAGQCGRRRYGDEDRGGGARWPEFGRRRDSEDWEPPSKGSSARRERTQRRSFGACHRSLGWPESAGRRRRPWLEFGHRVEEKERITREERIRREAISFWYLSQAQGRRRWRESRRGSEGSSVASELLREREEEDKVTFAKTPLHFLIFAPGAEISRRELQNNKKDLQIGPWKN